jgi:UDP-N-acetylmuramate dehydrogenase
MSGDAARYLPTSWQPAYDKRAVHAVVAQLRDRGLTVVEQQPIGKWTTLGVGGAAAAFVEVADDDELATLMTALGSTTETEVPLLVLGRGSNLLVGDDGWPGLAVRLGAGFKWHRRDGDHALAGAGLAMPALAAWTATEGLAGLEFAAGIPATVGGSVRMNAGAHGGQTGDRLVEAVVVTVEEPRGAPHVAADFQFGYRRTTLPPRAVVTSAHWQLAPDDRARIRSRLDELRAWRRATQPLRQRNCGSVFTNPAQDSAGRLVDAAGLKGLRRGGAQVSDKHANFIVVDRDGTADDVRWLIADVRARVVAGGGPLLEPEVRLVGGFPTSAETGPG